MKRDRADLPRRLVELGTDEENGVTSKWARRDEAAAALNSAGFDPQQQVAILDRTADALEQIIRTLVDQRVREVFHPEEAPVSPPVTTPPVVISMSLTSEFSEEWLEHIQQPTDDGKKGIPPHHAGQKRVSIRLFIELLGDRPAETVTFEDAAAFRLLLLKLPSSHGKGRYVHAKEAIARASGSDKNKYTMKTVKRHFSALRGYWEWLRKQRRIPDGPNPFSGHQFPGTKSGKQLRDDWSVRDLERLFGSWDYRSAPRDGALHWLPLIALHSGMRLEEIARLRPEDITSDNDVPCFRIQPHPDGWDPKTEAGAREIPIHSWLLKHGFMDVVESRTRTHAPRLFPDLRPTGEAGSFGAQFSRDFSRLKIGLGVSQKTVFHSFRHTFRTVVDGSDIQERFIDAVMGHEGVRGEGKTYVKRAALSKRREVVEFFTSPLPLDFLEEESPQAPKRRRRSSKARPEARTTEGVA